MDKGMFVYVDDIPDFKKYDLVNIDEELHKKLFKLPPEKMPLGTSSLYIKGINYIETKKRHSITNIF